MSPSEAALLQFRLALFQLGDGRLYPFLCERVEPLLENLIVVIDPPLNIIALFIHGLTAGSGGSGQSLSHRWLPRSGR